MGFRLSFSRCIVVLTVVTFVGCMGCQVTSPVATRKLEAHQALIEKDGLGDIQTLAPLKVTAAAPEKWVALKMQKTPLYAHQQWRSPTRATGVGVVYAHMPIPLPVSTLLWFARQEYTKSNTGGKLLGQWTDHFGRSWFEAENNKYHVKGYAVVNGTDAWIVYSGYRVTMEQKPAEISLAERCQDTILVQPKPTEPTEVQADARVDH